ncbi:MAG: hypothetical protein GF332_04480 [Candidatus Moranbacteria bacterium]|nr:hypothetical protein [Candidatus Moranbacteria bacterium]
MNNKKDFTLLFFKIVILVSLVLSTLLLIGPAVETLQKNKIALMVLEYITILTVWQLIFLTSILTFSKDFFEILRKIKNQALDNQKYHIKNIKVYKTPSINQQKQAALENKKKLQKKHLLNWPLYFEKTYHFLTSEQLEILLMLSMSSLTYENLAELFSAIQNKENSQFQKHELADFLFILEKSALINQDSFNGFEISTIGKNFIAYLKEQRYID